MKRNKGIVGVTVCVLMFAGVSADAKFGIPKAPKSSGGGGDISAMKSALEGKTKDAVTKGAAVRLTFIEAQTQMLEALGLKAEYLEKLSEAKSLAGENKSGDLKKATALGDEVNNAIATKLDAGAEMTPKQEDQFLGGVVTFSEGLVEETLLVATAVELGNLAKEITENASGLDKAAAVAVAAPALELASMIPGDVSAATSTLNTIIKYCKLKGIELPKDVTDLI